MNVLISIVVPVYNAGNFLIETIESVIKQTYAHWELHLVDDGSTDNSAVIIKTFQEKDPRINYHYKSNGGQASARNFGIKKSTGEYVAFLDADDLWLPQKLAQQLEEIKAYKPDFLYGLGYYYFPGKDPELEAYEWVSGEFTGNDFFNTLYHSCAVNTNTVLVKKCVFETVGTFDESQIIRGTEDWDLWMRLAKNVNRVYGSPSRNVYYRIHDGGIHLQHTRMLIGKLAIYEKYDNDTSISYLTRKREYRYHYRELFKLLYQDGRSNEIRGHFIKFKRKDTFGLGTLLQTLIWPLISIKTFLLVSDKIIYRLAYPLEHFIYRFIK